MWTRYAAWRLMLFLRHHCFDALAFQSPPTWAEITGQVPGGRTGAAKAWRKGRLALEMPPTMVQQSVRPYGLLTLHRSA